MKPTQDPEAAETVQTTKIPAVAPAATCSDFPPRRRVEATVRIGADDITALVRALYQISSDVERGTRDCVSGGPDSGWIIDITEDESVTHDSYFEALDAHLNRQNAQTEGPAD